jgi:RNA polymerase sigma-70 factor (sigma-E family)
MRAPRTRNGVREEFERFVADSADDLLRTGYLIVWELPAAEDLVQECLLRVARRWPRVRAMDHPAAYARRILVNLALDGARHRSRHRAELGQTGHSTFSDPPDLITARELSLVESKTELMAAIGALAPRQRAALVLRYFEDLSEAETADLLGCSIGTVKSSTARALEHLRERLIPVPAGDLPFATSPTIDPQGDASYD